MSGELEAYQHHRNLAHYAADAIARALSLAGIAGPTSVQITRDNIIKVELTPHEAHKLADILEEGNQ